MVLSLSRVGGAGGVPGFISIDLLAVPQTVLQVAVYIPFSVTVIVVAVMPVFHITVPVQLLTVSTTLSPLQIVVLLAVISGVTGESFGVTFTSFEALLVPQLVIHWAV
jgi:hypothetical protein